MPLIRITQVEGMSDAVKADVIAAVTRAYAESSGKDAAKVWVTVTDVPAASWGVGGTPLG